MSVRPARATGSHKAAGVLMILSGISTVCLALVLFLILALAGVGVFWLFPIYIGIREIITGIQLSSGTVPKGASGHAILGIVGSVLTCNVVGLICEIIATVLITSNEPEERPQPRPGPEVITVSGTRS